MWLLIVDALATLLAGASFVGLCAYDSAERHERGDRPHVGWLLAGVFGAALAIVATGIVVMMPMWM